ncbi:hypothetical protein WA026_016661 [Henosepilachna vigintioctopunctata]|uniref:PHD-type domain-containing protein n=1 Tax=Henosepilachna vigintioctopunctata TaxID=420089 RepID=A0AAW1UZQ7_9CUCU
MVNCTACSSAINKKKPSVSCDACKKPYHIICVTETENLLELLRNIPGLSWKCMSCIKSCITLNSEELINLLDNRIKNAVASLESQIVTMKSDMANNSGGSLPIQPKVKKYSDVLKDKSQPAVIIRPRKNDQPLVQTKSDILRHLNPTSENLQLTKVKTVKDGGLLIACHDNSKVKQIIEGELADTYEIKEVSGIHPRLRVVGMAENLSENNLRSNILSTNSKIFQNGSEFKVVKIFPTKKNPNIWQSIVQVNKSDYERALQSGNVFVGLTSCSVYDAVEPHRCFKCNEFNHTSRSCRKTLSCPICSEAHELKECKSKSKKCSNCVKLPNKDIDIDHAVWEKHKCTAYVESCKKFRISNFNFK